MEKINGICIEGKFYDIVKRESAKCDKCNIYELCSKKIARRGHQPCLIFDNSARSYLRYSQELTDKINKE